MIKRTIVTWLIFFCFTFGIFSLLDVIGIVELITLKQAVINAIVGANFYFIFLLIMTRKRFTLAILTFCVIGSIIILVGIKSEITTAHKVFKIDVEMVIRCIICMLEYIEADIQARKYKKEKSLKQNRYRIEFEEISPNGEKVREGKIKL